MMAPSASGEEPACWRCSAEARFDISGRSGIHSRKAEVSTHMRLTKPDAHATLAHQLSWEDSATGCNFQNWQSGKQTCMHRGLSAWRRPDGAP